MRAKQLLLIGGGHAHMVTLARLDTFIQKGYEATVIQPSEYHYYSGMGPGMLGGTYKPDDLRFATKRQVEALGGRFVLDKAHHIDPHNRLVYLEESDEVLSYDVLSCNAGSGVPPLQQQGKEAASLYQVKPIEKLCDAARTLQQLTTAWPVTVAVIGGGPSAVEVAGNIHQLCRRKGKENVTIILFAGHNLLAGRPPRVRRLAAAMLRRKGILINDSVYVHRIVDGNLLLDNDETVSADVIISAVGVKPSQIFARSGLPVGPDGGLEVNRYLQSTGFANIFGGGDCIYFKPQPLDKVGVYAVRQNMVLYNNLLASLEGRQPKEFHPGGDYLLIYNLGDGEGIFSKWSLTFSGKLAFLIKDAIDRRFIRTFQKDY